MEDFSMRGKFSMNQWRVASSNITTINRRKGELFVFGSNKKGEHNGGAAKIAYEKFGAHWGVGEGKTGCCYALPTMEGYESLKHAVERFLIFARYNMVYGKQKYTFLVTKIGCGIAGYSISEIAPLFKEAIKLPNVYLPIEFWEYYVNN